MKIQIDKRIPDIDCIHDFYDDESKKLIDTEVYACNSIEDFSDLKKWVRGNVIEYRNCEECFLIEVDYVKKGFYKYAVFVHDLKPEEYSISITSDDICEMQKFKEELERFIRTIEVEDFLKRNGECLETKIDESKCLELLNKSFKIVNDVLKLDRFEL